MLSFRPKLTKMLVPNVEKFLYGNVARIFRIGVTIVPATGYIVFIVSISGTEKFVQSLRMVDSGDS